MNVHPARLLAQADGPKAWDWDFAWEIVPDLLSALWVTVQATVVGVVLAMVLGLVFAIARRSTIRLISWPVAVFIEFVRSTPLLVQLFFLFFVLPDLGVVLSGFVAGALGLGIHYACYTSESYRAGIESVDRGQWEAAQAINLTATTTWRSVILPQAIPTVIPALGNYLVAMFKDAPLLSTITVLELVGEAKRIQAVTFRPTEAFTLAGVLFLAVSIPSAALVRYLERRFRYERA
jgi:polar amino acid transport system permease protein